jgi:hypothetical protein
MPERRIDLIFQPFGELGGVYPLKKYCSWQLISH